MKNSTGRKLLEQKYGTGCFMERAGIRIITEEEESKHKKIKGYKKLDRKITYHHIKEKYLGGEVSIENGANLADYNHRWLHQQSLEVVNEIDRRLQEFKLSIDMATLEINEKGLNSQKLGSLDLESSNEDDFIIIPVYDNTIEDNKKRNNKFNRAKEKAKIQNMIEEELYR